MKMSPSATPLFMELAALQLPHLWWDQQPTMFVLAACKMRRRCTHEVVSTMAAFVIVALPSSEKHKRYMHAVFPNTLS